VPINGATQALSGLLLATRRFRRPAAAVLAGTLIPTALAAHPFWRTGDPAEQRNHRNHF
jgi:uncharacterized membrane protein YphA (DoxX/SURF4 family)